MKSRRKFLRTAGLGLAAVAAGKLDLQASPLQGKAAQGPLVISTWNHGLPANKAAWKILKKGGSALDAVEAGVRVVESDPGSTSVGYGGMPDREGNVTLDACIMNHKQQCGAVAFLQEIKNPISVARKVMEETPHVMLVGEGALQFAVEQGFKRENLLTENAKKAWQEWLKQSEYRPRVNWENHDTIGMLALDEAGNLSGACTTSGMAWKLHGRVGDSPIIGSGLFVDNEVGAVCATGMGEAIIRVSGSAMVVELMRQGKSPEAACKAIVQRVLDKHKDHTNLQVGFLALNKNGEYGGYSVYNGFNYAVRAKKMKNQNYPLRM